MSEGLFVSHKNPGAGVGTVAYGGSRIMGYFSKKAAAPRHLAPQVSPPLLRLGINSEGKMHAQYDPEKLTEAALALMAEVARLQAQG